MSSECKRSSSVCAQSVSLTAPCFQLRATCKQIWPLPAELQPSACNCTAVINGKSFIVGLARDELNAPSQCQRTLRKLAQTARLIGMIRGKRVADADTILICKLLGSTSFGQRILTCFVLRLPIMQQEIRQLLAITSPLCKIFRQRAIQK